MIFNLSSSKTLVALAVASSVMLAGCSATANTSSTQQSALPATKIAAVVNTPADIGSQKITLEQAMADPDWMGNQPEGAYWASDSSTIIYAQKEQGNTLRDLFSQSVTSQTAEQVALNKLHTVGSNKAVYSKNKTMAAYTFKGNVFVKNLKTGELKQITATSAGESKPQFLNNGDLVYRQGNVFFKVDLKTGLTSELANLKLADEPKGIEDAVSKLMNKTIQLLTQLIT